MSKKKPKALRSRQSRRTPDARALEWAKARMVKAVAEHTKLTDRIHALDIEIPRLATIIAALGPTPTFTGEDLQHLKEAVPMKNLIQQPSKGKPRVVAGMDVSRFVTQRPPAAAPPVTGDDEDALLAVADANLPQGTPVVE